MNKEYNIQEFIKDKDLVIKCDTIEQCIKVGKYLWFDGNFINKTWQPLTIKLPYICWYSKNSSAFNFIKNKYKEQIIINFEDVIFEDKDDYSYLVKLLTKLNIK